MHLSILLIIQISVPSIWSAITLVNKTSINQVYMVSQADLTTVQLICPNKGNFYKWMKYHYGKKKILFEKEEQKLDVNLKLSSTPVTYECKAMGGFGTRHFNTTIYVIESNSKESLKQCSITNSHDNMKQTKSTVPYLCFLRKQVAIETFMLPNLKTILDCEAGVNPNSKINITYTWFRYDNNISLTLNRQPNSPFLRLNSSKNDDVFGGYLCSAKSTDDKLLHRKFQVTMIKHKNFDIKKLIVQGPRVDNIEVKEMHNVTLKCNSQINDTEKWYLVQWGKRIYKGLILPNNQVNSNSISNDNKLIQWEDVLYHILDTPLTSQIRISPYRVVSTFDIIRATSMATTGHYICVVMSDSGLVQYKTFIINVVTNINSNDNENRYMLPNNTGNRSSLFFLYILIPSLIIGVSLFAGIYLSLHRRPGNNVHRKNVNNQQGNNINNKNNNNNGVGSSDGTLTNKTDIDTMLLRHTPEYGGNNQHQHLNSQPQHQLQPQLQAHHSHAYMQQPPQQKQNNAPMYNLPNNNTNTITNYYPAVSEKMIV